MLTQSYLQTITIKTKTTTKTGKRQNVPTWAPSATGVSALISPMSVRSRAAILGPSTDEVNLLFVPAGTSLYRDDIVMDEETSKEYTVMTQPVNYKNPVTGEDSHLQCEIMPLEPNE